MEVGPRSVASAGPGPRVPSVPEVSLLFVGGEPLAGVSR